MDEDLTIVMGKRNLRQLTGYREDEVERIYASSLMKLVEPEDQTILQAMMQESVRRGSRVESQFRILCKNGSSIWVLAKTAVGSEADGKEYHYCTLTDITTLKSAQSQLESNAARDRMILDRSGGIIFQWDLHTDRVVCTDEWQQQFGYAPISEHFSRYLSQSVTHFHPDDLPTLRINIDALKHGHKQLDFDVRIADWQGKYIWIKFRVFAIYDEAGIATQIMGIMLNIDDLKRAALSMKEQAERDSLTKLLNKASTQESITAYLSTEPTRNAGMILLDLDNFKQVNDSYGHLYGDALLTQVSAILRKLLRSQDIIGRVGGDEFLVLLRDVPNAAVLNMRCQLILDAFRDFFAKQLPNLDLSCSAGCVLYPAHGDSYAELFQHADEALYAAKSQGKNQGTLYDPKMPYIFHNGSGRVATRVDSDVQPALDDNTVSNFAFSRLYESRNIADTINELLAVIGSHYDVSRVYIFENTDDNTACCNTFEWCNVGIPSEKDNLQHLSYVHDIPGFRDLYNERDVFYCTDITQLATPFRDILEPQGVKSILHCAILDGGVFKGYVGFDECTSNRLWTQGQIATLKHLAQMMSVFLVKQRTIERATAGSGVPSTLPPIPQEPV
jgi:diguanylate cyclase (GGDEF)-like protein/PAS domain S-box-containing protein